MSKRMIISALMLTIVGGGIGVGAEVLAETQPTNATATVTAITK